MGRKKGKNKMRLIKRMEKIQGMLEECPDEPTDTNYSAKELSKRLKRKSKQMKYKVSISKEHKWYQVRVIDSVKPSKEFLEDSFKSMIDSEFIMLGFHTGTSSVRFFLEDNASAAHALESLNKRMTGVEGSLMTIIVEPCKNFLLLNITQLKIVEQVLHSRYSNDMINLTNFHRDPVFMQHNLLPVMWDPVLCKQMMVQVKTHIPNLKVMFLPNNSLRLTNLRIIVKTLQECRLERINLENNDLVNLKELLKLLKTHFEQFLIEIKLANNPCCNDIKDPILYFKLIRTYLPLIQTIDGQDVASFLASQINQLSAAGPSNDGSSPLDEFISAVSLNNAVVPSTSINNAVLITHNSLQTFLEHYYSFMDSHDRLKLLDAYTPTARFEIESKLSDLIPSVEVEGIDGIRAALSAVPLTKHTANSFQPSINESATESLVKVAGQVMVQGREELVEFVQKFKIIPYNAGLGCSESLVGYKEMYN